MTEAPTPEQVIKILADARTPLMIHDIARRLWGTAAYDPERFGQLKVILDHLEHDGPVRSFRPSPTMQRRYALA